MKEDVIGSIRFRAKARLKPWDEPDDCIISINGKLRAYDEASDETKSVGKIEMLLVRCGEATTQGHTVKAVCDAHSDALLAVHKAVFDADEPKDDLGIAAVFHDFLYLADLKIESRYRGSPLAVQVVRTAVQSFCPNGFCVARNDLRLTDEERRRLGFREVAGTKFMLLDHSQSGSVDRE